MCWFIMLGSSSIWSCMGLVSRCVRMLMICSVFLCLSSRAVLLSGVWSVFIMCCSVLAVMVILLSMGWSNWFVMRVLSSSTKVLSGSRCWI